jgi:hypothetical protein
MIPKVFIDATAHEVFCYSTPNGILGWGRSSSKSSLHFFPVRQSLRQSQIVFEHHSGGLRADEAIFRIGHPFHFSGSLDEFYPQIFRLMHQYREAPMTFSRSLFDGCERPGKREPDPDLAVRIEILIPLSRSVTKFVSSAPIKNLQEIRDSRSRLMDTVVKGMFANQRGPFGAQFLCKLLLPIEQYVLGWGSIRVQSIRRHLF